ERRPRGEAARASRADAFARRRVPRDDRDEPRALRIRGGRRGNAGLRREAQAALGGIAMASDDVLRIANCSGFYGDRLSAAREMVEGGPIDVLTGDYLAELTLMILFRDRLKSPDAGYARTFLRQMEEVLGTCIARGIRVVVNAGGLNPAGLAAELEKLATKLGVRARIAHVEGDDLLPRLAELQARGVELRHLAKGIPLAALDKQVVTANAYLGAWGIVEALERGADVVICPRVPDAALTLGPAAWNFGSARDI